MTRAYSMHGVQGTADRAVAMVRTVLLNQAPSSKLHDVSFDPRFQHLGVDLLWDRPGCPPQGVEVKGDRQGARRGNYFFELVSNAEKNTPGCFLYSTADVLAYVFLDVRHVHLLDLWQVRKWLVPRAKGFPLKTTKTKTGAVLYTTLGIIVPVQEIQKAIPHALQLFTHESFSKEK